MTLSVSSKGPLAALPAAPRRCGLQPHELIDAGILTDPNTPEGAYKRAYGLAHQGAYRRARLLLYGHARHASPELRPKIAEILGLCAKHSAGDWMPPLRGALEGYSAAGDRHSAARVHRHMGEMLLVQGQLRSADANFKAANAIYRDVSDNARAALCGALRARVRMRAGTIALALRRIDNTLAQLIPLVRPRQEGLARLDRAILLAYMGDTATCAREVISAERMLASSGKRSDQIRARVVRAETLLIQNEVGRAAAGLRRLLLGVVDVEDVVLRAEVHMLLGRALSGDHPAKARRHLMHGAHLYQSIGSPLGDALCRLSLAQVERRLGVNSSHRLRELIDIDSSEWPLFAANLRIVRAEAAALEDPALARKLLFKAREFGRTSGNHSLLRVVDLTLSTLGSCGRR